MIVCLPKSDRIRSNPSFLGGRADIWILCVIAKFAEIAIGSELGRERF